MNPKAEVLRKRTKQFALSVLAFSRTLAPGDVARDIARQLARAATGVAANYRSGCRARSKAEFAARVGVALDEADESAPWLEIIIEDGMSSSPKASELLDEANQFVAIFTASCVTANASLGRGRRL
jgi:four helix bundle protein